MGRSITLKKCLFCNELKYCDRKFCSLECYWKFKKGNTPWNKKYTLEQKLLKEKEWQIVARKNYLSKLDNKIKVKARASLNVALLAGEVQRQSCEKCGKEKVEAHHYKGYERKYWLEVQWLCKKHHVEAHLNN